MTERKNRNYVCGICKADFWTKHLLMLHTQIYHPKVIEEKTEDSLKEMRRKLLTQKDGGKS